jgi:hypothetical protein
MLRCVLPGPDRAWQRYQPFGLECQTTLLQEEAKKVKRLTVVVANATSAADPEAGASSTGVVAAGASTLLHALDMPLTCRLLRGATVSLFVFGQEDLESHFLQSSDALLYSNSAKKILCSRQVRKLVGNNDFLLGGK